MEAHNRPARQTDGSIKRFAAAALVGALALRGATKKLRHVLARGPGSIA
jgi:hypothetical protein